MENIRSYKELRVITLFWRLQCIFEITKRFPPEERFSMVDQMRKASRSVSANMVRDGESDVNRLTSRAELSDSEGEAEETLVWLDLALRCGYISRDEATELDN